jgi:hypothetical protein
METCAICSRCFCERCTLPPRLHSTYSLRRHTCENTVLLLAAAKLRVCGRVIPLRTNDEHKCRCFVPKVLCRSCTAGQYLQPPSTMDWLGADPAHLSRICTYLMHMSGGVKGHAVSTVSVSVSSTATCNAQRTRFERMRQPNGHTGDGPACTDNSCRSQSPGCRTYL